MLYLLDANVLIRANDSYYPIDRVPEFWSWLVHMAQRDLAKLPYEIMEEIKGGRRDQLTEWLRTDSNEQNLLLDDTADIEIVQRVLNEGYAPDLTDDELEAIGRDPFLIAYAVGRTDRCVVTNEVSSSKKRRQNRKIPNVCEDLEVRCCDPFQFMRELGFSTSWNK